MNGAFCASLVNLEVRVYDLIHQVEGLVAGVVGRVLAHTLVFLSVIFEPETITHFLLIKPFIATYRTGNPISIYIYL